MGYLPASNPGALVSAQIQPFTGDSLGTLTPAIAALDRAFKDGLITAESIQELATVEPARRRAQVAGYNSQTADLADFESLRPQVREYRKSKLENAIASAPIELKKLRNEGQALDIEFGLAPRVGEYRNSQITAAKELIPDQARLEQKNLRNAIDSADERNKLELEVLRQKGQFANPLWEPVFQAAQQSGRWDIFAEEYNKGSTPGTILSKIGAAPKKATPEQAREWAEEINQLGASLSEAFGIREITKSDSVTGPLEGSWYGKAKAQIKALVGKDDDRTKQRRVEMFSNQRVLESMKYMKGAISNKEMGFLVNSVPKLNDPAPVWEHYLNRYEAALERTVKVKAQGLPSEYKDEVYDNYWDAKKSTGTSTSTGEKRVVTAADLAEVKPGESFWIKNRDGTWVRMQKKK